MASGPDYASSIATATDVAGRSWAAWAENGLIYAARWDSAANRWGDAAAISNASGGRNLQLTVGQLLRDSKTGQDLPTLVVTWESGIDNDADVLAAVGIYRNDGSVLWSDAVNLLPGGVAENNHSIGISSNRLVLATEAQAVVAPLASGPADGEPGQYQDSEINTYALTLQSRSSTLGSGDPAYLQQIDGQRWSGQVRSLVNAPGLSNGELISAAVNGTPLTLDAATTIPGLGSFTLSKTGQLSFERGSNPVSELLFTAELIGQGAGGLRSYARSSALLRPSELVSQATTANGNEGYTLSVSTLNGAGNVIGTSSVPLTFNASERLERVTATTFAPLRERADGSSLRDFTGSGRFSDGSLERAFSAAEGQTSLERSSLLSQAQPSSAGEWFEQTFANPYVLYKGQVNRFGISLSDLLNSLSGGSATTIPLLSALTSKTGFNIGFDGLINYVSGGEIGNQTLSATAALNFSLGRSVDSRDYAAIRQVRARNGNAIRPNPSSLTNRANQQTTKKKQVRFTEEAIQNGKTLNDRAGEYVARRTLRRLQSQKDVRELIEARREALKTKEISNRLVGDAGKKALGNSFFNAIGTNDKQALRKLLLPPQTSPNTAATAPFSIQYGYLFGQVPLRALELNFAARELYSYSTSKADGLRDPNLTAKRLQFGVGVNVGLAGALNLGLGSRVEDTKDPNGEFYLLPDDDDLDRSRTGKIFSILDIQGEAGLKVNLNFGLGFESPIRPLEGSLIWKDKNYERAYLPAFERASTGLQKLYLSAYYLSQGLTVVAPVAANVTAIKAVAQSVTAASDLGKTGLGRLAGGLSILNLGAQAVSQFPFIFTATDLIFSNLGASAFANRGKDFSATFTVNAYANGSVSFLNGLLSGYTRNSAGLIWGIYPPGLGYQYSTEVGFSVGGISKSLVNLRDSGTLAGNTSGFIANTFLEGPPALSASLYSVPASASAPLSQALSTPPLQISASGGSLNLAALAGAGTPLTSALAIGDLALSIYAVVVAPTEGAVDADGNLVDFRLNLSGSPLPLRLALDSRALLRGPARLGLAQPWQTLINQWADSGAGTSTGALAGIKPGSAIPLLLELRLPQGSDPASLAPLQLAYSLDGSPASFGTASAPLLAAMPASPLRRNESGSSFELGTTASGTIGAATSSSDPYIAGFVVAAAGSGYSDTDFILEEGSAVVRGRLSTSVSGGGVSSADLFQTASSTAFAGAAYNRLSDAALKARLSSGTDAQVALSAGNDGRLDGVSLALAADGKTALAGSGYLGGGSGVFSQWVSGSAATPGDSARALLRLVVQDGRIAEVGLLRQEGRFAASQAAAISLSNSVAGAGSGLSLVPLIRTTVDTNLLDESGLSIGGFQRYVDGAFRSEADLVYTQGGPDRSRAINSSLNLDTPLIVNRLAGDGRGWTNLAFIDPPGTITPGVDGFNFDSSSESLYFNNDVIGGKRSVVLFSHADLSAIRGEQDLYLLEEALLQAQVYTAVERKDARNNLFFDTPVLLSDPSQGGTNSNGRILPFYAVQGAGVAPIADANNQLLAAWVHTSPSGQAEIQVRIGSASGKADAGSNDSSRINWGPIRSIALPANVTGNDVTELGLTYLDGRTPVLSWSLNSLTPYQAGVLRGAPTAYYRLNDLPSEGSLANIAANQEADGQLAAVGEISRFSSWLDSADAPLTQAPVRSATGALLPPDDGLSDPLIQSGERQRTPLQQLNDRLSSLSSAHATAFGRYLGSAGISDQLLNSVNNTRPTSSWVDSLQQLIDDFAADYDQKATAIRTSIGRQFLQLYGQRIQFRTVGFGGLEEYDAWEEQGVADDYDQAVQQAISDQLGFDFPDSQRQTLRAQIESDLATAVSSSDPIGDQPGDADPALRFEGGAFGEVPNVFLNRLTGLSNEQPSGYAADFWVNTSAAEGSGSLLDNGLYNPNALLPSREQLKLPVLLRRTASTETIDGVETRGYRYSLVVAAGTFADLGSDGLGSGLSPFNLRFAAPEANLSFSSASGGNASFAFQGADLNDFVEYRTAGGKLSSFTLGDQEVELGSSFVADAKSPGTTKTPEVITYDSLTLGLQTAQIPGWSLRKRVVGERQFVDFNYGIDKSTRTPATLTAELPSGVWSHVAISYGEEQGTATKVARLFIDGQLAAEAVEDPENLKGYDFNLLPYQLGYNFKGSLDELVLSDAPLTNPADQLRGRLATRFVDPKSATQATQFSPGVFDAKTGSWSWQPAAPFIKADYIPSTIPGASRPGPVDMASAGITAELRGDGKADLHARLSLSGIAVGSLITGIRARVTAADGSIKEFAIGDGLSYGLDGKVSTTPISALMGVVANGTGLNSGDGGRQLNMAVMGGTTDLDLYLPVDPSLSGRPVELVAIVRSPQNRAEGGNRFTVWPFASDTALSGAAQPTFRATLEASNSATVLSPYYASQKVVAPVQRPETTSLLDVNSGFVSSLAQTNEPTLASPNEQVYAEALAAGSLKLSSGATPFLAIANPDLDGIAGSGKARGVVWVLRNDSNDRTKGTAERLQTLQSLVGTPESRLAATGLEGLVIVGRDSQQLGGSVIWADLDGDGNDELVLSCPQSESGSGVAASGSLVILNGAFLASRAASGSRRIDLNDASLYNDPSKLRLFAGPEGSEFGTALAYGKVTTNGNALLIGAPGYSTEVSTDFRGETIAAGSRQRQSVGAIFQLNADGNLFNKDSTTAPFLLISGDLPGLPNFNSGAEPSSRRFGSSISLTSSANNRDFNSDNIADIAIGIPGLVQSRVLKGGINQRATIAQREADLAQRSTIPDVYREGIDASSLSDPKDVTMGGVLLLAGGASSAEQAANAKKVLLLGDTMFGDAAGAGAALASGGDFNNDTIDDLAVGMPEVDAKTGAVSVISGATIRGWFQQATATNFKEIKTLQRSTVVDASLIIQNDQANGLYGRSLALNGDVNADGIADLVIGDANFAENSGRVNVLFGSSKFGGDVKGQSVAKGPSGDTIYHRLDISNPATRLDIYPGSFGEGLGRSVLLAPTGKRVNGTASADLLLPSSNGSSTLLTLYGKARLKGLGSFSSRDLGSSEGIEIDGLSRRPSITPSYGLLGDVNGDGNADALVDLDPTPDQARFRLNFGSGAGLSPDQQDSGTGGSSTLNLTGILRVQNPGASDFSLRDVQAIGDLNSDGSDDLLIRYGYTRENRSFERNAVLLGGDLLTSNVLLQSAVLRPVAAPPLTGDTRSLAEAPLRPIGTAITAANGEAPTLLGVAQQGGTTQLRWVSAQDRAIDIAALYDAWFAAFPRAASQAEQQQLDSFNSSLKLQLTPFDPKAADAAQVSADNLELVTGTLEAIAAGAGASFRNFVEGRSPLYEQQAISLLQTYGDVPSGALLDGDLPAQTGDVLLPGQRLRAGDYLLSPNGRYMAVMQADGNFVVQTRRSDIDAWDVSFSLNDYKTSQNNRIPFLQGTSLELRNGKLTFVNDSFGTADGSNALAVTTGSYRRGNADRQVNVKDLAAGTSLRELRLGDDGVLRATASDGSTVFTFERYYDANIISTPIPADKLQVYGRKITGYDNLDLSGRTTNLVDRNGDGLQELLVGPSASDPSWYSINLSGAGARSANSWFATLISKPASSPGSALWESNGNQPANALSSDQAGNTQIRKINGYTVFRDRDLGELPDQPVETGGYFGINGASLSRQMLTLGGIHETNTFGQYSTSLGGADLRQRLQQNGESFEFKVPAYVWQMKSKGDGTPGNEGGDELVLHIGSGQGIKDRIGDSTSSSIGLDGLAISFNEYQQTFSLFWNGQRVFQAGPNSASPFQKEFMNVNGGLNNGGTNDGRQLMSSLGEWFNNLFTSGLYLRYQQGAFSENGKTYQGRLIMEVANSIRYLPYPGGSPKLNTVNKGLQISIPVEQSIQLKSSDVNLNAYGWSGSFRGVHALAGLEFNTDKPLEGTNLERLTPVGDLNGDGYEELVGLGSLASGWNYDYSLDLPNSNLTERGTSNDQNTETRFTLQKGANGNGIKRSTLITPVIVWGGKGDVNLDALTPIVKGMPRSFSYSSTSDPKELSAVDNFSAAANVLYTPLGDANGDGFDDLAISDSGAGGSTYILYGGSGLRDAKSDLERFRAFFPETRAKDAPNSSPDVYLKSDLQGFGLDANGSSKAWIQAINLERSASDTKAADPAFGGIQVTKITGITGQQLADLSGGGDFSGDGLGDVFLTSQTPFNASLDLSQQAPSRYVMFGGDDTRSITLLGTPNSDSLKGTPVNDVILGLAGNDIVQGKGGMDAINAGPGDDQVYVDDDQFRRLDGGSGEDTLILQGQRNQTWDFTKLASAGRIRGFESIDAKDYGANSLTLNAAAARAVSGTGQLFINGDLRSETAANLVTAAISQQIDDRPESAPLREVLSEIGSRFAAFSFGLSDLSMLPVVIRDVERDLVFDQLRRLSGEPTRRPLDDLLERLDAIDAATPLQPGLTGTSVELGFAFLQTFSQNLAFTPVSALAAYQAWLEALPELEPERFPLLSAQQRSDLAALPELWKNTYNTYFNANGQAPATLAFERSLNGSGAIAEAYRQWLDSVGVGTYKLPAASEPGPKALLDQLNELGNTAQELLNQVLASGDSLRLSTEFALINSDVQLGSTTFSEYAAYGGSVRVLVPEWMAVLIDPTVPTTLSPTPATQSSSNPSTAPGNRLETELPATEAPLVTTAAPASRDDLRISVSESSRSDDGRSLIFTLTRSGYLAETSRVALNTLGYVADLVPSVQGQVVFAPGVTSQQVRIPLMDNLPGEQASLNPYDTPLSSDISLELTLLPAGSVGPRSTSVLALNALNAFTPELDSPSRPLPAGRLDPSLLFSRHLSLQLPTALWVTAEAINDAPIRFGLDTPQGTPLNDIQLLDRVSGDLVSLFDAAAAGDAVIYGDNYLSPSTDLYFSVNDGGRFDQDSLADGEITLAAAGALTSPGSLLIGGSVLRAPSARGMNLRLTTPGSGFSGDLDAYDELLLLPSDDINGSLRQDDGSVLRRSDGEAYLNGLLARLASDAPLAGAVRRLRLDGEAAPQALNLLNDTNYVAVLSRALPGVAPTAADLRLPSLRNLGGNDSRSVASYAIELEGQRLAFSLTSPYLVVPGVEGNLIALRSRLRAPSGRQDQPLQVAWLRVDDVDGNLSDLLAAEDLASRLTPVPPNGVVELQAGDLLLPVLFGGIDPLRWASLPAEQRRLGRSPAGWSVDLPEPSLNPDALLQRSGATSYTVGGDGLLQLSFGAELQATLGVAGTVLGTPGDDSFLAADAGLGLSFRANLLLSGDGADRVDASASADAGENVLLLGGGDDSFRASRGDVAFAGAGRDQIELAQAGGNRVDGGADDDLFLIATGGQRLLGGAGVDSFRFSSPLSSAVVAAGGAGGDVFWLSTDAGELLGAPLVISDFNAEEGDRLILPDRNFSELNVQQLGGDVQINLGNNALALLRNRSLEQISTPEIFRFESLGPDSRLSQAQPEPGVDPLLGDGMLEVSEIISDGVNGLAAFSRRAFGAINPQLNVYIHTTAASMPIGGGKSGAQTINTVAISDSDAEWMRDQIRWIASNLDVQLQFVSDRAESNLDIYYDSSISLGPDRSTLGITLANENGRQTWWELLLNASVLSSDPSGFRYAFVHELGHVFGLEHPFDSSDGDAEGQRFGSPDTSTTTMSYTRPANGWPEGFQHVDWQALVSLWGLNSTNGSGWRFRDAAGDELLLDREQALARLTTPQDGDQFLGRADGLRSDAPAPEDGGGNPPTPPIEKPSSDEDSSKEQPVTLDKVTPPLASERTDNDDVPPPVIETPPAAILSLTPGRIDWLPDWQQLDLELGVALTRDGSLQLLSPDGYGLSQGARSLLVDLDLRGSDQADVVYASSGSRIDLGLGQDTIFSLAANGGRNRLYGGLQSDRFLLAAPGDIVYGGGRVDGADDSTRDGAANQFRVDLSDRPLGYRDDPDAVIEIRDVQPGLDALTLIDGDPQQARPLPIHPGNYLEWRDRLRQEQNILLNAAPQIRLARRGLLITDAMLSEGFRIDAADFFVDADDRGGDRSTLRLVNTGDSLPWLQTIDGSLVVAPGTAVAPGTYSLSLAASDGLSRTPLTTISLAVKPTVSIGSLSLAAGSRLAFRFPGIGDTALELLVQTLDADGQPLGNPVAVAGQIGNSSGTPIGFDPFESEAIAGDLLQAGRLAFFLRRPDRSETLTPLDIRNTSPEGFRLLATDGTVVEASVKDARESRSPIEATTIDGLDYLGLTLPGDNGGAPTSNREVTIDVSLFREAAYDSLVSFYLADRSSGAVVDAITGTLLSGATLDEQGRPSDAYLTTAAAHTVFSGRVGNGQTARLSQSFQVGAGLNLDSLILLPLLTVDAPDGRKIYGPTPQVNADGFSHIARIGANRLGFEDMARGGDLDHDDILMQVEAVTVF